MNVKEDFYVRPSHPKLNSSLKKAPACFMLGPTETTNGPHVAPEGLNTGAAYFWP
jgi:hypothetical protein